MQGPHLWLIASAPLYSQFKFHSHLLVLNFQQPKKHSKLRSKAVVVGIKALRQVEPHQGALVNHRMEQVREQ